MTRRKRGGGGGGGGGRPVRGGGGGGGGSSGGRGGNSGGRGRWREEPERVSRVRNRSPPKVAAPSRGRGRGSLSPTPIPRAASISPRSPSRPPSPAPPPAAAAAAVGDPEQFHYDIRRALNAALRDASIVAAASERKIKLDVNALLPGICSACDAACLGSSVRQQRVTMDLLHEQTATAVRPACVGAPQLLAALVNDFCARAVNFLRPLRARSPTPPSPSRPPTPEMGAEGGSDDDDGGAIAAKRARGETRPCTQPSTAAVPAASLLLSKPTAVGAVPSSAPMSYGASPVPPHGIRIELPQGAQPLLACTDGGGLQQQQQQQQQQQPPPPPHHHYYEQPNLSSAAPLLAFPTPPTPQPAGIAASSAPAMAVSYGQPRHLTFVKVPPQHCNSKSTELVVQPLLDSSRGELMLNAHCDAPTQRIVVSFHTPQAAHKVLRSYRPAQQSGVALRMSMDDEVASLNMAIFGHHATWEAQALGAMAKLDELGDVTRLRENIVATHHRLASINAQVLEEDQKETPDDEKKLALMEQLGDARQQLDAWDAALRNVGVESIDGILRRERGGNASAGGSGGEDRQHQQQAMLETRFSSSSRPIENPSALLFARGFPEPISDLRLRLFLLQPLHLAPTQIWRHPSKTDICLQLPSFAPILRVLRVTDCTNFVFCGITLSRQ